MTQTSASETSKKSPQQALIELGEAHFVRNYRQQPVVLERGEGVRVWDKEGRSYLDLLGGIATSSMGHCHPEVMAAVQAQVGKLWHTSNIYWNEPSILLAEKLARASGLDRVFFCNSGAEANEAMLKLARKVMKDRGQPDRFEIIAFERSFHGRTLATVAATGQPKYQQGFEPLLPGFVHVPYGDLEAVKAAMGSQTAAVLVEVIQGEGGVRPAPEGFLEGLRELCDTNGSLLLIDEVQTGVGRTGKAFAYQHKNILPDAISTAKSLGGGLPVGAMVCRDALSESLVPGTHGSTFGGNPVACAGANVVMDKVLSPGFLEEIAAKGAHLLEGARALAKRLPERIVDVRGMGLLAGVELNEEAAPVVARCRELGLLVNLAGPKTVRFAPAYVVTNSELDEGLAILEKALAG
ncbi:MAG TPA: acetylornithine transaminase [Myxococcaceae bacterium]|nr:acetylornithine transaminase [Myxococcaceae bacterium]